MQGAFKYVLQYNTVKNLLLSIITGPLIKALEKKLMQGGTSRVFVNFIHLQF
jgi:hypothetical protein